MKRLLVVDGNSIINRAFYGIRALTTRDGQPTNAIYGAVHMIWRQLAALSPDYAAVAFDLHHPTFRHELYSDYKAGRRPTPPELLAQFDGCKECLAAMGLAVLELPGYEADDIQGTLAEMAASAEDTEAFVFSGDRDLLQLIGEKTTVLLAGNSETVPYRADSFAEKYGIAVGQYLDLKALMGDSSDNIPGVPGIGEKTAVKLLTDYGDLDGIFAHKDAPELSPGIRKKLSEGEESGRLSRKLVEIERNAPIGVTLDDIAYRGVDNDRLWRKFTEYEFTALIRQLGLHPPTDKAPAPSAEIKVETPTYTEADEATLLRVNADRIAVEPIDGGLALATEGGAYLYRGELAPLAPILAREGLSLLCYDGKALLHRLHAAGIRQVPTPRDLLLYAYLLRAGDGVPSLPALLLSYLGASPEEGAPTAHLLLALEPILAREIDAAGCRELLETVELPLSPLLCEMEETGFGVDVEGLISLGEELGKAAEKTAEYIYDLAGHPFNIQSPKQLGEVLFGELGMKGGKKTKTGYSTNAEVLEELREEHPIVSAVLEYRQLSKLRSTYAVGLVAAADGDGRIHTEFKQALTATGRLSSAEPNLQNIPVRTELGRLFRRLFVAREGMLLVDADYSQIELRLLAHISDDREMLAAFASGVDIHTMTAASVFHIPYEMVTPELRKQAKAVNFGIMYGIGAHSLSKDLHIPHGEAKQYIESYKASYPGIAAYLEKTVEDATEQGYTTTLLGRRRLIPELASTNKMTQAFGRRIAMNAPIQGSSADIMKLAMLRVASRLAREIPEARLVMQVHDELIVEAPAARAEQAATVLREEMESAVSLSLPLSVEVAIGKTWDAK